MASERSNVFHQVLGPDDAPELDADRRARTTMSIINHLPPRPTPTPPAPAPAPPTVTPHPVNMLETGQQLTRGDRLTALNGRAFLTLQNDGNLVLYRADNNVALWSSHTFGKPVTRAVMQADGNLVCYDDRGHAYWATGTNGRGGTAVVMQDDANLVIYAPGGRAVWASNTWHDWSPFVAGTGDQHLDTGEWMNSSASMSGTGLISGHTRIWTTNEMAGFHGSVLPVLLDADGKIIWPAHIDAQKHWYGVDGSWIPFSTSDRTCYWTNQVDEGTLARARSLALIQFKDPKNMLLRDLDIVSQVVKDAAAAIAAVASL